MKLDLNNVAAGFAATTLINSNSVLIENAIENTLSRDGTGPNEMHAALDMNGNMILNQANPITVQGFQWTGPWVTAHAYTIGQVVEKDSSSYIAIVAHTSGVWATDLAAAKWQLVAGAGSLPTQTGHSGDILTTNGTTASWGDVNSLALPITGGTLTGPVSGTNLSMSGTCSITGPLTLGSAIPLIFEGVTPDSFQSFVVVQDPTADRSILIPDADLDLARLLPASTSLSGVQRNATRAEAFAGTSTTTTLTPDCMGGNANAALNGWIKYPGGYIIQQGEVFGGFDVAAGGSTLGVVFPITFPTTVFHVMATIYTNDGGTARNIFVNTVAQSSSGATFYIFEGVGAVQATWWVFYTAWGK